MFDRNRITHILTMALPSKMIKKSFPDSPCVTTTSPSSNEVASNASATVSLSHLSKFSIKMKNNFRSVLSFKAYKEITLEKTYFKRTLSGL